MAYHSYQLLLKSFNWSEVVMVDTRDTLSHRKFVNFLRLYIFINNQVEEDEMGGPCSTNGGEKERV
jgi:hypothetical protein